LGYLVAFVEVPSAFTIANGDCSNFRIDEKYDIRAGREIYAHLLLAIRAPIAGRCDFDHGDGCHRRLVGVLHG
jgi:hypothetical protein